MKTPLFNALMETAWALLRESYEENEIIEVVDPYDLSEVAAQLDMGNVIEIAAEDPTIYMDVVSAEELEYAPCAVLCLELAIRDRVKDALGKKVGRVEPVEFTILREDSNVR